MLDLLYNFFSFDFKAPMLFNSGLFLFLFFGFLIGYLFLYKNVQARLTYVIVFSLYFYYKSSGYFIVLFLFTIIATYYLALLIDKEPHKQRKNWLLFGAIVFNLSFLLYFKYTNFFLSNVYFVAGWEFKAWQIILPIGISFYTFQAISYLVDVKQKYIPVSNNLTDFVFYMTFFPHLVAGPIVRARDFLSQIREPLVFRQEEMSEGLMLVIKGLIKKAIIADYIAQYVDLVYKNPAGYSGFENLMAMYAYTLQIYCDFSGYSDMAIGIALLMGYRLKENFMNPYRALDITEFWRKWHISLSGWLRDYIYIPLGGNRKGEEKQWLFLFLTMLIGGFWHGADWKFIFWGAMHGMGLLVHKIFSKWAKDLELNRWIIVPLGWLLTFHFVAFLWIFFRADSFHTATVSIHRIVFHMDWAYLPYFFKANSLVVYFLLAGYASHFIPDRTKKGMQYAFQVLPFYIKAVILLLIIQIILQVQDENVQPFIYFQF
ncbi:MAG: MBOAT family protein [Bacteroidetes bacterium]|nr:MAG: MBOAT family protein [Bacteroidota bacterium]